MCDRLSSACLVVASGREYFLGDALALFISFYFTTHVAAQSCCSTAVQCPIAKDCIPEQLFNSTETMKSPCESRPSARASLFVREAFAPEVYNPIGLSLEGAKNS